MSSKIIDSKIIRDENSKAVVVIDQNGLEAYKKRRSILKQKDKKIDLLEDKILIMEEKLNLLLELAAGNKK